MTRERIEEIARRCGEAIRTRIGHWQYKDGGVSFDNIGALCALALKGLDAGESKPVAWDADGVEIATSSAYHEGYETGRKSALAASTSPADGAVEALEAAKSAAYAVYVGFVGERDRLRDGDPLRVLAEAKLAAASAVLTAIVALLPKEANSGTRGE